MKFKKFISGSLAIGLLFNSTLPSFASTLSQGGRYEIFEGSNIAIGNVLEEDKVDIEIEGNTMVNLVSMPSEKSKNVTATIEKATMLSDFTNRYNIKPNTEYTYFMEVRVTNASNNFVTSANLDYVTSEGVHIYHSTRDKITLIGNGQCLFKLKFTTGNDVSHFYNFFTIARSSDGNIATGTQEVLSMILLEGDCIDNDLSYFEGMKSVGQDDKDGHNIEVTYNNQNLWRGKSIYYQSGSKIIQSSDNEVIFDSSAVNQGLKVNIQRFRNKTLSLSYDLEVLSGTVLNFGGHNRHKDLGMYIDGVKKGVYHNGYAMDYEIGRKYRIETILEIGDDVGQDGTYSSLLDKGEIGIEPNRYTSDNPQNCRVKVSNFVLKEVEAYTDTTQYIEPIINKIGILLNEPLRRLPNGVKDRIIKKDGQWVVERNCKEVVLDGSSKYTFYVNYFKGPNADISNFSVSVRNDDSIKQCQDGDILSDRIPQGKGHYVHRNNFNISTYIDKTALFVGTIPNSYLDTVDVDGLIKYFNENPSNIVYQLAEPVYEPLNIDLTVNTYLETTYISNNSTVPANMKVTVDRAANRAVEAIELAKENPTIENISLARMWCNLLKESTLKDDLQNDINEIVKISDLEIEKKTATANLDLYVKSKNSLTMSLSTNSVTFESYSGVEDLEMLDAVNIIINSSLPYSLNAYMSVPISNADGSNTIDTNILNIRDNTESNYNQFINTTDKVVLKDDCTAGNNNIHNIDLKLSGSNLHKADVYKTVIKFEAEQK